MIAKQHAEISEAQSDAATPIARVAVVGAGPFGAMHAKAIQRNVDAELIAIVNRDVGRARELAVRIGVERVYASVPDLLAAEQVDGITVATANSHHVAPTLEALAAGVSVLLEKPVAPTLAEARTIQDAAQRSTGFVLPAHLLRFAAPYRELQHRLGAGEIGNPRALSFRRHRGMDHDDRFHDTHPVLMTMIHDIDLAIWLDGGKPSAVRAREIRIPGKAQPLAVWAEVETDSGNLWSFHVSWSLGGQPGQPGIPDSLEVVGEEGTLALRLDPRVHLHSGAGEPVDDVLTPAAAHGAIDEEIRHFIETIRRGSQPTVVTLDEAVDGLSLAERLIQAASQAQGSREEDGA